MRIGRPSHQRCPEDVKDYLALSRQTRRLTMLVGCLIVGTDQPDVDRGRSIRAFSSASGGSSSIAFCWSMCCVALTTMPPPTTGMLLDVAAAMNPPFKQRHGPCWIWRDIDAGMRIDCKTVLWDCGYTRQSMERPGLVVGGLRKGRCGALPGGNEDRHDPA
jgi:hypothetical protein